MIIALWMYKDRIITTKADKKIMELDWKTYAEL